MARASERSASTWAVRKEREGEGKRGRRGGEGMRGGEGGGEGK